MISRQKALEIIEKFEFFQGQRAGRELWEDKPEEVQERDLANFNRDCRLLKEFIKSQPPADQWIPCSEPPKEDGMYFITAEVLGKLEVQYVFYQKNLNLFICNGTPTAWMPLPKPYKGVE